MVTYLKLRNFSDVFGSGSSLNLIGVDGCVAKAVFPALLLLCSFPISDLAVIERNSHQHCGIFLRLHIFVR